MFDFQKLEVYKKAKIQHSLINSLTSKRLSNRRIFADQLGRASLSIVLNIAEGTGRPSKAVRRNFFHIARGSVYECVAIVEILLDEKIIVQEEGKKLIDNYVELSKMLFGLINSQS